MHCFPVDSSIIVLKRPCRARDYSLWIIMNIQLDPLQHRPGIHPLQSFPLQAHPQSFQQKFLVLFRQRITHFVLMLILGTFTYVSCIFSFSLFLIDFIRLCCITKHSKLPLLPLILQLY